MHNCKISFPGLSCNQLVSSQLKLAVHAPGQRQDVLRCCYFPWGKNFPHSTKGINCVNFQRISGQATLLELGRGIAAVLAPLMPHLTEEMALCCPALHSPNKRGWHCDQSWLAQDEDKFVTLLEALKEEVVREVAKPAETNVVLEVGEEWKILIENLVEPEKEIAEVLGVLRVSLTITEGETNVKKMDKGLGFNCLRCRRLLAEEGEELCSRCSAVVAQKN